MFPFLNTVWPNDRHALTHFSFPPRNFSLCASKLLSWHAFSQVFNIFFGLFLFSGSRQRKGEYRINKCSESVVSLSWRLFKWQRNKLTVLEHLKRRFLHILQVYTWVHGKSDFTQSLNYLSFAGGSRGNSLSLNLTYLSTRARPLTHIASRFLWLSHSFSSMSMFFLFRPYVLPLFVIQKK